MQTDRVNEQQTLPAFTPAVEKYYALVDNPYASSTLARRIFFEFLRTGSTLTDDEIQTCHAIADLLAELEQARRHSL
ncbi:hypothetical protein Q5H93_23290 [Hymenobacter sp. ASUV-10]|uniref:Four helix bundle protein n=1 Tax=Hymenobacter aranciens TaxID=3063996 RepID=A0ABT9BHD9_9BACT|nr:hypothetical protein [Hymenobacter sp. ASUV-10]MDO7877683.1 hypothetical protein [Hymenobacter sp. ASUV-10]